MRGEVEMKMKNKNVFLKKSAQTLEEIFELLANLPVVPLKGLQKEQTALVMVDMVNGFTKEGALKQPKSRRIDSRNSNTFKSL